MNKNIVAILFHIAILLTLIGPRDIREQLLESEGLMTFIFMNVFFIGLCIIDLIRKGNKQSLKKLYRVILTASSILFIFGLIRPNSISFLIVIIFLFFFPLPKILLYSMFTIFMAFVGYKLFSTGVTFDNYLTEFFIFLTQPLEMYVLLVGGYLLALTLYFFQKVEFETRFSSFLVGFIVAPITIPYVAAAAMLTSIYTTVYYIVEKYFAHLMFYNPTVHKAKQHYLQVKARQDVKERRQNIAKAMKAKYGQDFVKELKKLSISNVVRNMFNLQKGYIYLARLLYLAVHIVLGYVLLTIVNVLHRLVVEFARAIYMVTKTVVSKSELKLRNNYGARFICSTCYHTAPLPLYVCSSCGEYHVIEPGEFGIFKYRCKCGEELPNRHKTGRENLTAVCPGCYEVQSEKLITPFVIPLLGQPNSGTTSFLYKGVETLLTNDLSNRPSTLLQPEDQLNYQSYAQQGTVPATLTTKPKAFGVKWQDKAIFPKALYLYDVSGRVFQEYDLLKQLKYMDYADGYIFVVDSNLAESKHRTKEMLDMLTIYFTNEQGVKLNEKINKPIAIIFNKHDALGYDASSLEVRQWLREVDASAIYNDIEMNFSNVQYFFTDSNARSADDSQAAAMKWIMQQAGRTRKLQEGVL